MPSTSFKDSTKASPLTCRPGQEAVKVGQPFPDGKGVSTSLFFIIRTVYPDTSIWVSSSISSTNVYMRAVSAVDVP